MTKTDLLLLKVDIEESINAFNKKCDILGCPNEKIIIGENDSTDNNTTGGISPEKFIKLCDKFNELPSTSRDPDDVRRMLRTMGIPDSVVKRFSAGEDLQNFIIPNCDGIATVERGIGYTYKMHIL